MKVFKKIMAVLAVLVIIALYAAVFLCAIFIKQVGNKVFLAALVAAVLVPLMAYLVFWLCSLFRPKQPLEEDSWEVKTKKGFQEASVFNRIGESSYSIKNAPRGSHCGGLEDVAFSNSPQAESFASETLSGKGITQASKEEDGEA